MQQNEILQMSVFKYLVISSLKINTCSDLFVRETLLFSLSNITSCVPQASVKNLLYNTLNFSRISHKKEFLCDW